MFDNEELELKIYEKMCKSCPYAKKCHEECEYCDEFLDEYYEKEHNR